MNNPIQPTHGRIVWYRGKDGASRAAIVVGVNSVFNLNLFVFGYNSFDSEQGYKDSVTHADPAVEPTCLLSWDWMPYQKQQAEKHASEAARADEPKTSVAQSPATGLSFGTALMALKTGQCVARAGWNGKGQFVLLIQGSNKLAGVHGFGFGECAGEPTFGDTMFLRTVDNRLIAWTPSQSDALAEDWWIVEADEPTIPLPHEIDAALGRVAAESPVIARRLISERQALVAGLQESVRKD